MRGFRPLAAMLGLAWLGIVTAAAHTTAEEKELTEGHPVRLADAYAVTTGDGALLGTGAAIVPRRGSSRGEVQLDAQYGIIPHTQLSLSTVVSSEPGDTRDPASGDLTVAARVGSGPATGLLPLLAGQLAVTLPTGAGSRSVDIELKGYATKGLVVGLLPVFVHVNASIEFRATELATDERLARYHLAAGASFTLPRLPAMTVVGDVFVDQAVKRGRPETVGLEAGVRYRVAPRVAIHGAIGRDLAGPESRAAFYARVGLSVGFVGPGHP
jgi:hypothetical protein